MRVRHQRFGLLFPVNSLRLALALEQPHALRHFLQDSR